MEELNVGDRVFKTGWAWKNEPDKYGTVVKRYRSRSSPVHPGHDQIDVQWDDGSVGEGHLLIAGSVKKAPMFVGQIDETQTH